MFKVNQTTVAGKITKSATASKSKDGQDTVKYQVTVVLPSNTQASAETPNTVVLNVIAPGSESSNIPNLTEGKRIVVNGELTIRIRQDGQQTGNRNKPNLAYFLNSDSQSLEDVPSEDSISGKIDFIGHVHKNIETKTNKKGFKFLVFSAYASEKNQQTDEFYYQYVRFLRFTKKGETEKDLLPTWLVPKARIKVTGDIQLSFYNGNLGISSRVDTLEEMPKKEN